VPAARKLQLVARAGWECVRELPSRALQRDRPAVPTVALPWGQDLAL
jgi:hypothetical protein